MARGPENGSLDSLCETLNPSGTDTQSASTSCKLRWLLHATTTSSVRAPRDHFPRCHLDSGPAVTFRSVIIPPIPIETPADVALCCALLPPSPSRERLPSPRLFVVLVGAPRHTCPLHREYQLPDEWTPLFPNGRHSIVNEPNRPFSSAAPAPDRISVFLQLAE